MMKVVSVLAEDSAAIINQCSAEEETGDNFSKISNCMREPPQLSTDVEERPNAVAADDERTDKDIENRKVISNQDNCGFTASEILESIEVEEASREVSEACIVSNETRKHIKMIVNTDDKMDTLPMHEDTPSVSSGLILHEIQVNDNRSDEMDFSVTRKDELIDDKWKMPNEADKKAKHNHGGNILQTIHVRLNSEDYVVYITSSESVKDDKLEISMKGENIESCVVPIHQHDDIQQNDCVGPSHEVQKNDSVVLSHETDGSKQNEFPGLHSRAASVTQHSATEASGEIVTINSSLMKEPSHISSTDMNRSTVERGDSEGEKRDVAIIYERHEDIEISEKREMILLSHSVGGGLMAGEMLDSIQVELTSEEVIDAFIVSKETVENIKALVESDKDEEVMLRHEDVCSVTSTWTLHNVQIDVNGVEEIDVCLTSISTHYDDKWKRNLDADKQVETNHGEKNTRMTSGEMMSDVKPRSTKKLFSGIKESCDVPCETHPGVYKFEIIIQVKEEGKERFIPPCRPSPLLRRTTRRALALVEDTSPLSTPWSTLAKADQVKDLSSDHNLSTKKDEGVDNVANVAEDLNKSENDRAENCTNVAKDINESQIVHVECYASVREDIKESKIGRVPSSILRKSTLKKKKERQDQLYDEKSVYSTFSTDTYDSFQSLVREVEKEALLCFVKVGRYFGL